MRAVSLLLLASLAAVPAAAQTAGYAGQQTRDIKALSSQETADLLAGRGMGLARAGELNSYPGPMHVLEHADALRLAPAQRAAAQALRDRMADEARAIGVRAVVLEEELDALFAGGAADPGRLAALTTAIGVLLAKSVRRGPTEPAPVDQPGRSG